MLCGKTNTMIQAPSGTNNTTQGVIIMDTQWEYKILTINSSVEKTLNELGQENWEVVASGAEGSSASSNKLILKRPKRTQKRNDDYGYGR